MARYKRAAGIPLSDEEAAALRQYGRRYYQCRFSLYVPERIRTQWEAKARAKGQSVSEWTRDRVFEALGQQAELERLERVVRDLNLETERARREALQHAQKAEQYKVALDEREREYAFLLRRVELVKT
jgi:hypothetical protein